MMTRPRTRKFRARPQRPLAPNNGAKAGIPVPNHAMILPHDAIPSRMEFSQRTGLNVVIEMELVGVRAQPDGIDLLVPFVIQPSLDHVLGEDIAAQQKGVIGF